MEYCTCPSCNNSVSKKTIERVGICNNCVSFNHIEKIKNDNEYLLKKLKNPLNLNYVLEIIDFIYKSEFSYVLKYRVVFDFIKILNEIEYGKNISEDLLHNIYFQKSSYKSIGILEIIKVFLFSKNLIIFDLEQQTFYPKNIRPHSRYETNILDYYYDKNRCSDCGDLLTLNTEHSYCYNCIDFRSLFISTSKEFIDDKFKNEKSKFIYINYIKFLSSLGKSPDTINDVLRKSVEFINFVESYIPSKYIFNNGENIIKNDLKVITNSELYQFNLSESWVEIFNQKFSSNKKKYFLEFLIHIGILNNNNDNSDKIKEKIISKIENLPLNLQKPLFSYLTKVENEIENYKKKNATKEKKWETVKNKFYEIVTLGKWLIENHGINSWAEVSDKEINIFLLALPEKSRLIRKRSLYNFFEFAEKKRWIFNNPIENFVARDFNVETKPLSKKEHAQIYNLILKYKTDYFVEVFTTSLVYFHALTSKQLTTIELNHIDPLTKSISIPNRPRVYLSELEFLLLTQLLINREEKLKGRKNKYLYCSYISISEKSINSTIINKHVKKVTGMTAKDLRIASLQFCAEQFGIEYLNQCLGLSLTQSSRYGDIQDYYIDEIIADSVDFNN